MYEVMFYSGIVVGVIAFSATLFMFFWLHIPSVIRYFIASRGRNRRALSSPRVIYQSSTDGSEATNILGSSDSDTSLLEAAQHYATALLDADNTELLPALEEDKYSGRK